jgi:hypothetical protein
VTPPLLVLERAVAICRALGDAGFEHALGGALCLAFHVQDARATNDIDVNVMSDPQRPDLVFRVLPAGVRWADGDVEQARRDGQVRLHWVEGDLPVTPVDVFLPQHAFHAVAASRFERVPLLDTEVPVLAATDLAIFKALFDRLKDWADIEELLRYGEVDRDEVVRWLTEVVGAGDPRLDRFAAVCARSDGDGAGPTARELFGPPG